MPVTLVAVDIETTGLDPAVHQITEIGWVVRTPDGTEHARELVPHHTLDGADPQALELTRYHERIAPRERTGADQAAELFAADTAGASLVGASPNFDVSFLRPWMVRHGIAPAWHHRLIDVEGLAAPFTTGSGERLASLKSCAQALGVPYDADAHHGALYDAQLALQVYDAYWARIGRLTAA